MKKRLSIFVILLISIFILPFNIKAANIIDLDVENNNGKLTVSGTTESDVYAIAVVVYSGNDLVHMETCSNDESYSCELSKTFDNGTYTVKVADYNGGDYLTQEVVVKRTSTSNNPKTLDNILLYIIIACVSLVIAGSCGFYFYKKNKKQM